MNPPVAVGEENKEEEEKDGITDKGVGHGVEGHLCPTAFENEKIGDSTVYCEDKE